MNNNADEAAPIPEDHPVTLTGVAESSSLEESTAAQSDQPLHKTVLASLPQCIRFAEPPNWTDIMLV